MSGSALEVTHIRPYGVTGEVLNVKGQQTVSSVDDGREFSQVFGVLASHLCSGFIRHRFFKRTSFDFGCGKMSLTYIGKAP